MNSHLAQGIAAMQVSQFLRYSIASGMVDEILHKHYTAAEADQIKAEMVAIADQMRQSADYHRSILRALEGKP